MLDFSKPLQIVPEHRVHENENVRLIGHFDGRALVDVCDCDTGVHTLLSVDDNGLSQLLQPAMRNVDGTPANFGPRFENQPQAKVSVRYCNVRSDGSLGPTHPSFGQARMYYKKEKHLGMVRLECKIDSASGKVIESKIINCENL